MSGTSGDGRYSAEGPPLRRSSYASIVSGNPRFLTDTSRNSQTSQTSTTSPFSAFPYVNFPETGRTSTRSGDGDAQSPSGGSMPTSHPRSVMNTLAAVQSRQEVTGVPLYAPTTTSTFIPPYLRTSRYAERLQDNQKAKVEAQQERLRSASSSSNLGSLSTSSSSVNLRGLPGVHRGISLEVVENRPDPDADSVRPLPTSWSYQDRAGAIDVFGDGLEVKLTGARNTDSESNACAVRTDHPMPVQCGVYYYELTIMSRTKGGDLGIGFGFCTNKVSLNNLPGWEPESWGYHGDDGKIYPAAEPPKSYGPSFGNNDVVGCGVNFRTGQAFYTRNGVHHGTAFTGLNRSLKLYPAVGLKKSGEQLKANFGQQPFVYDIVNYMQREREQIERSLMSFGISSTLQPFDEDEIVQYLVAQYLAHGNYLEACEAFQEETKREVEAIENLESKSRPRCIMTASADSQAPLRQEIRKAILRGDVDGAVQLTNARFPSILAAKENNDLYFRLRCLKFVELIRKSASQTSSAVGSATNGTKQSGAMKPPASVAAASRIEYDAQMEIDEQPSQSNGIAINGNSTGKRAQSHNGINIQFGHPEASSTESVAVPTPTSTIAPTSISLPATTSGLAAATAAQHTSDFTNETWKYGKELKKEFGDSPSKEIKSKLNQTFALISYDSPETSALSHLMDVKERIPVADDLNTAILNHLGRSGTPSLEKLFKATEALITELSNEGGPAAFVNVRRDFVP